jgi:hypothetical protein
MWLQFIKSNLTAISTTRSIPIPSGLRDGDYNVWSMEGGPTSKRTFDALFASFRFVAVP